MTETIQFLGKTYLDGQMPRWREIQERMRVS